MTHPATASRNADSLDYANAVPGRSLANLVNTRNSLKMAESGTARQAEALGAIPASHQVSDLLIYCLEIVTQNNPGASTRIARLKGIETIMSWG